MWPRWAHVLVPLTSLQGKKEIQWTDIHTKVFNAMKALMMKDCLLSYPDPNIPYDIQSNASSDYQMGNVIKQMVNQWHISLESCVMHNSILLPLKKRLCRLSSVSMKQYGCEFKYIPGPDNVIANAFSSVPRSSE
eukprot:scaffold14396_cov54-Attheya_sp.AAC.1